MDNKRLLDIESVQGFVSKNQDFMKSIIAKNSESLANVFGENFIDDFMENITSQNVKNFWRNIDEVSKLKISNKILLGENQKLNAIIKSYCEIAMPGVMKSVKKVSEKDGAYSFIYEVACSNFIKFLGQDSIDSIKGKTCADFCPGGDASLSWQKLCSDSKNQDILTLNKGRTYRTEKIYTRDGDARRLNTKKQLIIINGERYITSESVDITAERTYTDKLWMVIDEVPFSVYFKSLDGRFLHASHHTAKYLYEERRLEVLNSDTPIDDLEFFANIKDQLIANKDNDDACINIILKELNKGEYTSREIFGKATESKTFDEEVEIMTSGQALDFTEIFSSHNGSKYIRTIKAPQKDEQGNVIGFLCISLDETQQEIRKQELQEAKMRAEESERLKTSFYNNLSHEIRTPLNAILGYISLLANHELSDEFKKDYISQINASSSDLLHLMEDMLCIAQIQEGTLKVEKKDTIISKTWISDLWQRIYIGNRQKEDYKSKEINFDINLDNEQYNMIADPFRVRQVFANILSNAFKFVPFHDGEIKVNAVKDGDFIKFKLRNNSLKIRTLDNIFKSFVKDEKQYHRGVGLGLTITKNLVEMMGGKIWVENDENNQSGGVSFYFTLPISKSGIKDLDPVKTEELEQLQNKDQAANKLIEYLGADGKLLLVEDDLINMALLKNTFKNLGISPDRIVTAGNGLEALNSVKSDDKIKFIFTDGNMPVMSGFESTQKIREMPDREIKIIAQSGESMEINIDKYLKSGINGFLLKPVENEKLYQEIIKVLSQG